MDYRSFHDAGSDDDLPPSYQIPRGTGAARAAMGSYSYSRMQAEMEIRTHNLEKDAYSSVLRAFKAQADAITWDKEGLITELRKELRVSDDEHRELLAQVNSDDVIREIREWRHSGSYEDTLHGTSQALQESTYSRKRNKPYTSVTWLPHGAPSPTFRPQSAAVTPRPSFSSRKKKGPSKARGRPAGYRPARSQSFSHRSSGPPVASEYFEPAGSDPLIGRKILTRWPEENYFYEAIISDFNPLEGRHALVYDKGTAKESWEWVNLNEIPPEDIRWEGEDPPSASHRVDHGNAGRDLTKTSFAGASSSGGGAGVGSRSFNGEFKSDLPASLKEGTVNKNPDEIEIFHTETLLKKVEKVLEHPNPTEIVKAKLLLKEQEQALVDLIAKLGYVSDGESDKDKQLLSNQALNTESNKQNAEIYPSGKNAEMAGTDVNQVVNVEDDAEKQKDDEDINIID